MYRALISFCYYCSALHWELVKSQLPPQSARMKHSTRAAHFPEGLWHCCYQHSSCTWFKWWKLTEMKSCTKTPTSSPQTGTVTLVIKKKKLEALKSNKTNTAEIGRAWWLTAPKQHISFRTATAGDVTEGFGKKHNRIGNESLQG